MSCHHERFEASCDVTRVLDGKEGGDLTAFALVVRVACAACGEAFGFRGVPCGVSVNGGPTRSADALELRAWLLSPSEITLAQRDGPTGIVAP